MTIPNRVEIFTLQRHRQFHGVHDVILQPIVGVLTDVELLQITPPAPPIPGIPLEFPPLAPSPGVRSVT